MKFWIYAFFIALGICVVGVIIYLITKKRPNVSLIKKEIAAQRDTMAANNRLQTVYIQNEVQLILYEAGYRPDKFIIELERFRQNDHQRLRIIDSLEDLLAR